MNLREAAQQALEVLEKLDEQELATGDLMWLGKEIGDLRSALEPVTTCHELYETACANATYKVIDYFCHTTACSDVNVTYIRKILDEFAEQAICCKGGDKLSPSSDHIGDTDKMVNECGYPDCALTEGCVRQCPAYPITDESLDVLAEDRSAGVGKTTDDADDTPEQRMLRKKWFGGRLYGHLPFLEAVDETMKRLYDKLDEAKGTWKMLDNHFPDAGKMVATIRPDVTVEPVAWRVHPFDYGVGIEGAYAMTMRPEQVEAWKRKGWNIESLYAAPPKREPLTDDDIEALRQGEQRLNFVTLREFRVVARAIERAHGIGGEE